MHVLLGTYIVCLCMRTGWPADGGRLEFGRKGVNFFQFSLKIAYFPFAHMYIRLALYCMEIYPFMATYTFIYYQINKETYPSMDVHVGSSMFVKHSQLFISE